jgi:hypothetical protein
VLAWRQRTQAGLPLRLLRSVPLLVQMKIQKQGLPQQQ